MWKDYSMLALLSFTNQKIQHQCDKGPIRTQGLMRLSPPGMNLHSFCFLPSQPQGPQNIVLGCPKFHEMLLVSSQGVYTVSLNTTDLDPVTSYF